jgi:SAM-dependent methyltransferase
MDARADSGYSGLENLEVMREAVRYNAWLVELVRRHAPPGGGRVLDFGAGSGTFSVPVARSGLDVTCLEPDGPLRDSLRAQGLAVAAALPELENASFDYVYSLNVLEHIDDDAAALRGLSKKLRPGGVLLLYVPAFGVLYSSMDRNVGHFRRYRRHGLVRLVQEAGLDVTTARYVDCLGFLAALLYRVIGSDTGKIDRGQLRIYDSYVWPLSLRLDGVCGRLFGKNLLVLARRRSGFLPS